MVKLPIFGAVLFSSLVLSLTSCGGKDPICDCIQVGDELNKASAKVLQKEPTAADEALLIKLRKKKVKACKNYQTMSGVDMLKRKESCQ